MIWDRSPKSILTPSFSALCNSSLHFVFVVLYRIYVFAVCEKKTTYIDSNIFEYSNFVFTNTNKYFSRIFAARISGIRGNSSLSIGSSRILKKREKHLIFFCPLSGLMREGGGQSLVYMSPTKSSIFLLTSSLACY